MNRFILSMVLYMGTNCMAFAQFGTYTASEMQSYIDKETGVEITVLTDTARNDRFLYQTDPMWTSDGKYLLFRSSSRGNDKEMERRLPDGKVRKFRPTQIYFIEMETGKIIQATEGPDLGNAFLANKDNRMFMNRNEMVIGICMYLIWIVSFMMYIWEK